MATAHDYLDSIHRLAHHIRARLPEFVRIEGGDDDPNLDCLKRIDDELDSLLSYIDDKLNDEPGVRP